jgi:Glycosyl transferase family 11
MIILKLKAGLGNQLFEYAYSRALALRSSTALKLDLSWYQNRSEKDTPRTYDLCHYNIVADKATDTDFPLRKNFFYLQYRKLVSKIKRSLLGENDYTFYTKYAKSVPVNKTRYVEGHFNSEKYFLDAEDHIRKELTLKKPLGNSAIEKKDKLLSIRSSGKILVLIHVRRGDYVSNPHAHAFHGTKDVHYYESALQTLFSQIEEIEPQASLFFVLASDNTKALAEEIEPLLSGYPSMILSDSKIANYEEIYLISLCDHFIIANSSFSWWGAWLSTESKKRGVCKIVIGPEQWVTDPNTKTPDVLPTDWLRA